ncbi:hypothetical protein [Streptomyces anulatus]|uniref:hypothetical protein n=1 Tax=Streptomyces anulatus TaxID=1892 RepID=UPI003332B054
MTTGRLLPARELSLDRMIHADSTARWCASKENAPVNITSKSAALTFGAALLLAVSGCPETEPVGTALAGSAGVPQHSAAEAGR